MQDTFTVNLDFFSGPMDLLLHLVHRQELPIAEVSMSEVAEQYLDLISRSACVDVNRASEYLVIAATLVAMKSRSLLPKESGEDGECDEWYDDRFFENLRQRLIAFEKTKLCAEQLRSLPQLGLHTFERRDRAAVSEHTEFVEGGGDPQDLGRVFIRLLRRIGALGAGIRIRLEPISVVSFMMKMIAELKGGASESENASLSFVSLVGRIGRRAKSGVSTKSRNDVCVRDRTRQTLIGSFLALLELMRRGLVSAYQEIPGGDIVLRLDALSDAENRDFDAGKIVTLGDYRRSGVEVVAAPILKEASRG